MNSFSASTTKLGFIGLGGMGTRIAARLLAAGYDMSVFDRNPAKRDAVKAKGARAAESLAELAGSVHVVLSCLTNDQSVRDVYFGGDGVLENIRPETVVIEMSTILPATSRELASKGVQAGVQVLDVAISGSTPAAEQGTVTLLAGGNPDVFQASLPIFQAIAAKYFHLGPSGAGTTMKMVVNAILGVEMQAIAEAAALGEKAGFVARNSVAGFGADGGDRAGSCGETCPSGARRVCPSVSIGVDEQRFPANPAVGR